MQFILAFSKIAVGYITHFNLLIMYSVKYREKAKEFRRKGYSLKEIADELSIAKSTASVWVRNVKLSREAKQRLEERLTKGQINAAKIKKERRKKLLEKLYKEAYGCIEELDFKKEHLKLFCAVIYWCEGGTYSKKAVRFTNSDPDLVELFLFLFRKSFRVDEDKFRACMHLHDYHDEEERKDFWSRITGISKNQFIKTYQKPHTAKRIRDNYPGCLNIRYYDALIAKELLAFYKAFKNKLID